MNMTPSLAPGPASNKLQYMYLVFWECCFRRKFAPYVIVRHSV